MNEKPFKLDFIAKPSGILRADFEDDTGVDGVLKESGTRAGVWLGLRDKDRLYLNREMCRQIGAALYRFYHKGTIAEPSPEQQIENLRASMDEFEQYDSLCRAVLAAAREFAKQTKAFSEAHVSGANREGKRQLLSSVGAAEDRLCSAVEALEAWKKQHGWNEKESEEAK